MKHRPVSDNSEQEIYQTADFPIRCDCPWNAIRF